MSDLFYCPYCAEPKIYNNGRYVGPTFRYQCQNIECRKTFKDDSEFLNNNPSALVQLNSHIKFINKKIAHFQKKIDNNIKIIESKQKIINDDNNTIENLAASILKLENKINQVNNEQQEILNKLENRALIIKPQFPKIDEVEISKLLNDTN